MSVHDKRATIFGLGALFLWSTTITFARSIAEQLGPFTTGTCIYCLGTTLSTSIFYIRKRSFPFQQNYRQKYLLICGSLFMIYMLSLYGAIAIASDRIQLLEVGLVNYLWPIFTVLFSLPILKESASRGLYLSCLITLIGIMLVVAQNGPLSPLSAVANITSNPIAYLLALIAALTWGMYSNTSRLLGQEQPPGAVILFMGAAGLAFFALRSVTGEVSHWSLETLLETLYLSVAVTLGYIGWDTGMRRGNFTLLSVCSYGVPLLSTAIACLYFQVLPGITLWIGGALIVIGAYASNRSLRPLSLEQVAMNSEGNEW